MKVIHWLWEEEDTFSHFLGINLKHLRFSREGPVDVDSGGNSCVARSDPLPSTSVGWSRTNASTVSLTCHTEKQLFDLTYYVTIYVHTVLSKSLCDFVLSAFILHSSIHHLPLVRGSGRGRSSFNRETQTSLTPATSSSSSGGTPRRSQASRET